LGGFLLSLGLLQEMVLLGTHFGLDEGLGFGGGTGLALAWEGLMHWGLAGEVVLAFEQVQFRQFSDLETLLIHLVFQFNVVQMTPEQYISLLSHINTLVMSIGDLLSERAVNLPAIKFPL